MSDNCRENCKTDCWSLQTGNVTKKIRDRLKKKYFHSRHAYSHSGDRPKRLIIEKAKWLNNADSPVMLMIDDLANAWHSTNGTTKWDKGGDWGGGLDRSGSAVSSIRNKLLANFPEIRVTFFAVAGRISQYTHHQPFTYAEALNINATAKAFFRRLHDDDRFEIAYHGFNHGTPGANTEDFVQEWRGFGSVDDACEQIRKGREIFKDVCGEYPRGGKYGGWEYNEFADESIDRSGFLWWCRDWMPREVAGRIHDSYYEPHFFGKTFVVAIPSTVHGFYWSKKQIDKLLSKRQIISIEEHIAAIRPDGLVQTPNISDDMNEKTWHATGTEIAEYFTAYALSTVCDIGKDSFDICYTGRVESPRLTVMLDLKHVNRTSKPVILMPDGKLAECLFEEDSGLWKATIRVRNGRYTIEFE
jgi:hypothetical protein